MCSEVSRSAAGTAALPPVSVIMAVYNGQRFLGEAIDSILSQTHERLEFIIVDDGSTDETPGMLAEYARRDPRIQVVSQTNQDQPASLNTALRLARYEWVAVIDHDDVSLPERLETQLRTVVDAPEIRVLGTSAIDVTVDGAEIGFRTPSPSSIDEFRQLRDTGGWIGLVHPSALMHRETIIGLGGYDPQFGAAADSELWSRVADHHIVLSLPVPLVRYRVHTESMSFTRFFEQQHAVRWLRSRQTARWRQEPPPTSEQFLRSQRGLRSWRGVNYRRQDLVSLFTWRARMAHAVGKRWRERQWILAAYALAPKRALRLARHWLSGSCGDDGQILRTR